MKVKEVLEKRPDRKKQKKSKRTTNASSAKKAHLSERQEEQHNYLLEFLAIVASTSAEFQYQIMLVRDLGYLNNDDYRTLLKQVIDLKRRLEDLANSIGS